MPHKDPEKKRDYQREYMRLQFGGLSLTPAQVSIPLEFKLNTAQDILGLLAEQISAVKKPLSGDLRESQNHRLPGLYLFEGCGNYGVRDQGGGN